MSNNLYKVMELDNEITDKLCNGYKHKEFEIQMLVSKLEKLLPKLNNKELLYVLREGNRIHEVIDVAAFLKKYKINKKELKMDNSYSMEFKKLNNFIALINDASLDETEYMFICNKCDVDNVASYLLSKMSNIDIMSLSKESDDWNYKLFLYGNLKV